MKLKPILPLVALAILGGCAQGTANEAELAVAGSVLPEPPGQQPAHPAAPPVATPPPGPPPQLEGEAPQGGPPPMPAPVTLASRPDATGGEALYIEYCGMCHAPNGMGHGLLGRRMEVADLEDRDNLVPQYIQLAVRRGIGNMPPVPRGELSDEKLAQISDYLIRNAGAAQ